MKKSIITVTEAARNFSDCINRVNYQETTFVLLKNGSLVARIVPDREKKCTGRDLAAALKANPLDAKEARVWKRDLDDARRKPKPYA